MSYPAIGWTVIGSGSEFSIGTSVGGIWEKVIKKAISCRFSLTNQARLYILTQKPQYIATFKTIHIELIVIIGATAMENLGKQITERRKKLGLSQEDLAEISGVSPRTINSIELGKANPSINVLNKMVKPLGFVVTLSERVTHE